MSTYLPDTWVVLRFDIPEIERHYRVLAGWSGGYTQGDSWRMNSGITKIEAMGDGWLLIHGETGSIYQCHEKSYGLRMSTAGTYNSLIEKYSTGVLLMDENTDWLHVDWKA